MRTKLFSVGIDDCRVDTFTVGGHGGAGKDTSNTGVRVTHEPSGAVGKSTESRRQSVNKRTAFHRMGETTAFRAWARLKAAGFQSIDAWVEDTLKPGNIRVEVMDENGAWVDSEAG